MPTYVALMNWTEQGIRNVKDTVNRRQASQQALDQMGVRITATYWTQGAYDLVAIFEAPDDETASAGLLGLAMQGNLRTQTLRAYSAEEMQAILQKLP